MISAAAGEKASGRNKDNNRKKDKFIKGCIRKIESERKILNYYYVSKQETQGSVAVMCVCECTIV